MQAPFDEPFDRFTTLFAQAQATQPKDPNQMWLATVDAAGWPSVRVVLLKGHDTKGFVFFTNHCSDKGQALEASGKAALCFYWPAIEHQVRVQGTVAHVAPAESDAYFASRPRDSQLGAWASHQSQPIASREVLEGRLREVTARFEGRPVARPPHWGGFRVTPRRMEFWQAHPDRLHFRQAYQRTEGGWQVHTLSP
jgi:pyridoxamine 5'-phosphate oxidase